ELLVAGSSSAAHDEMLTAAAASFDAGIDFAVHLAELVRTQGIAKSDLMDVAENEITMLVRLRIEQFRGECGKVSVRVDAHYRQRYDLVVGDRAFLQDAVPEVLEFAH